VGIRKKLHEAVPRFELRPALRIAVDRGDLASLRSDPLAQIVFLACVGVIRLSLKLRLGRSKAFASALRPRSPLCAYRSQPR
jgi:hypothetical protein